MKKITCISIILIFKFSNLLIAQQDLWETFTTDHGLSNNNVNAICESRDGALWFGTAGGVSRYYEGAWEAFTKADGLANNNVETIYKSRDGALWFGTMGGVSRYQDGTWTTFTSVDGLPYDWVIAICESSDGSLWFGTQRAGACRYYEGKWTTYNRTNSGLAGNQVSVIYESNNGALWFGCSPYWGGVGGVSRYQDGVWTTFTEAEGLASNDVLAICESRDGALWFGTLGGGVSRNQDGIWTTFNQYNGLADNIVNAICKSSTGALWLGTEGGVSWYQDGKWKNFTTADGLADNHVQAICEISDGILWFGTFVGVSRYQPGIWTTFTEADGLVNNWVKAICESNEGALWFGTNGGGVSRYQDGKWQTFNQNNGLADRIVHAICKSSDGALWFGTKYGGVSKYQDEIWTTFNETDGLANNNVHAICQSGDGALWFGTYGGGISRYQDGIWTTFSKSDGLADSLVFATYESSDGALWFGTKGGVSRYQDGNWKTFTMDDGLIYNWIFIICESSDGALWFGSSQGASRYQDDTWTKFTTADGLVSNNICAIIRSSDGALWFGCIGGVSRYQNGYWKNFTTDDGLADNFVYTIYESNNGTLWFGTNQGISGLKPDKIPPFTFIIEGPENKDIIGISRPLFVFSGKDYGTKPDQLKFSHTVLQTSIIPDSNHWTLFSNQNFFQTEDLQNGSYTFYVRAKDPWGNIDTTAATRTFTVDITPPTLIISSPKQRDHIKGKFNIIGSAFDNSPIKDFKNYKLRYDSYISETQEPDWKEDRFFYLKSSEVKNDTLGIFLTFALPDDRYQINLWAVDSLEHESEDNVLITIDNTSPQVEITFPQPDDTVRNEIHIQASIFDENISELVMDYKMAFQNQWKVLPQDSIIQPLENQLNYCWENSSDSGDVYLRLTVWDKAGNSSSNSVTFVLDNEEPERPTVEILEPQNNDYLHELVIIKGYATDENFTNYSLYLKSENLDTLLIENDTKKENEELFILNTRSFPDGDYEIHLTVLNDKQYQKTDMISVTIDNTLPVANIIYPLSEDTISCFVQIQGKAEDRNLKSITLEYAKVAETDTSKFILIDTTSSTYWNTMDLNGNYNLYLSVEDKGGLKTVDKTVCYIDNPRFKERDGLKKKQDEFSLYIPPSGYNSSVICLEKRNIDEFDYSLDDVMPTELICEIHSSIEEKDFNKPVVLTIDYNSINLTNFNEDNFYIFTYHENKWDPIGGTVDRDNKTITTTINQIGIYGLFENNIPLTESKKDLNLSFQPRIFSPQGGGHDTQTAISFELGKESNLTIKIYNPAGRLVKVLKENEKMSHGNNVVYWDGKDQQGEFCVSGLYIVTIQAEEKMATKTVVVLNKY